MMTETIKIGDAISAVLYGGSKQTDLTVLWAGTADVECDGLQQRPVIHAEDDGTGRPHNLYLHPAGDWCEITSACRDWTDEHGNEPPATLDIDGAFV